MDLTEGGMENVEMEPGQALESGGVMDTSGMCLRDLVEIKSSNTAEVEAVIKAIEQAMEADIKRIQVNLDSQSVVDFVNFRFKEQKMKDDFKKLAKLVKRATNAGMEIKTNNVKGHSGVEGNVEANRLAQRYTIKLAKFKEAEIG